MPLRQVVGIPTRFDSNYQEGRPVEHKSAACTTAKDFSLLVAKQLPVEVEVLTEKTNAASFTCPVCGWMVKSPFGKEDVDEHAAAHNAKHHAKTTRARISKSELLKLQRK